MQKSSGITPTERYLVRLCERAFLRLWSYPNLYRDQGGGKDRSLIDGNELPIGDVEKSLRILAAESRLSRRHLARALRGLLQSASADGRPRTRCLVTSDKSGTGYCFLVYPCPPGRDRERHRLSRSAMLADYCRVMKVRFPDLKHILGYATEPPDGEQHSEDLAYLDATNWTEEDDRAARELQRDWNACVTKGHSCSRSGISDSSPRSVRATMPQRDLRARPLDARSRNTIRSRPRCLRQGQYRSMSRITRLINSTNTEMSLR